MTIYANLLHVDPDYLIKQPSDIWGGKKDSGKIKRFVVLLSRQCYIFVEQRSFMSSVKSIILASSFMKSILYEKSYLSKLSGFNTMTQRSFSKGMIVFISNKELKAIKEKQAKMQCDDGYPVYLKGGIKDKILYHVTIGLVVLGLADTFQMFCELATK